MYKFLSILSGIFIIVSVGGILYLAFTASDANGVVTLDGNNKTAFITFGVLGIIGMITTGISMAATREGGNKVSGKAVIAGIALALIFLAWRIAIAL